MHQVSIALLRSRSKHKFLALTEMMQAHNRVLAVAIATTLLLLLASNSSEQRPQSVRKSSRRLQWTLDIFWAGDPTRPPPPPAASTIPNPPKPPPVSSPSPPKENPWENPSSFDSVSEPAVQSAGYVAAPPPSPPGGSYSNQVGGRGGPTIGASEGGDSTAFTEAGESDMQETLAFQSAPVSEPSTAQTTAAYTAPSPVGSYSNQVNGRGGPTSGGSAAAVTTPAPVQSSLVSSESFVDNEDEDWSAVDANTNTQSQSFVTIWVPEPEIEVIQPAPAPNPSTMIQKSHPEVSEVTSVQVSFNNVISCSSESDCRPYNQFCSQGTCRECLTGSNVGCRASEVCSIASGGAAYCVYMPLSLSSSSTNVHEVLQTKYQNPPDNTYFCGTTFSSISSSCLTSKPCPSTMSYLECGPGEGCFEHAACKAEYDSVGSSTSMAAFAAFGDFGAEENSNVDRSEVEEVAPMWMTTGLLNSGYSSGISLWWLSSFAFTLGLCSM